MISYDTILIVVGQIAVLVGFFFQWQTYKRAQNKENEKVQSEKRVQAVELSHINTRLAAIEQFPAKLAIHEEHERREFKTLDESLQNNKQVINDINRLLSILNERTEHNKATWHDHNLKIYDEMKMIRQRLYILEGAEKRLRELGIINPAASET